MTVLSYTKLTPSLCTLQFYLTFS